jgi:hypothetical protein
LDKEEVRAKKSFLMMVLITKRKKLQIKYFCEEGKGKREEEGKEG